MLFCTSGSVADANGRMNFLFSSQFVSLSLTMPIFRLLSPLDADTYQDVVVEIERAIQKNPYLGGYRHKVTKTEFHHAGVQTMARKRPDRGVETSSRETQVKALKILSGLNNQCKICLLCKSFADFNRFFS